MPDPFEYRMGITLNVLNHLGMNLYSNVPSVIAEVVANSWDADAQLVDIVIDPAAKRIVITDDGMGMNQGDANDRYLTIGYERRNEPDGAITPKHHRKPMGRKGIGKLSLFSIAERIEVHSVKDGQKHGWAMDIGAIKEAIRDGSAIYKPEAIDPASVQITSGTRIILTGLKRQISIQTAAYLRRRLARRFSIIGARYEFEVKVDQIPITIADRNYFHKIQYLWTYGSDPDYSAFCTNVTYTEDRLNLIDASPEMGIPEHQFDVPSRPKTDAEPAKPGKLAIRGWIGTVERAGDLKDGRDSLNKIVVLVRGKLAQEDILEEFGEGGIYSKYVIGEIHADFLDVDEVDDIATSSRQRIIEEDPRYRVLADFIDRELTHIQSMWTAERNKQGFNVATQIEEINAWYEDLPTKLRPKAKTLFGRINRLTLDDPADKREIFKHSVIAFEILRHKDNLEALDDLNVEDLAAFSKAFEGVDDLDATMYYQIVSQRLKVIRKLDQHIEDDVLEKIIQRLVFNHLWLLDPSWERATLDSYMEKQLKAEFKEKPGDKDFEAKSKGRVDIKVGLAGGRHVIVELKRAGRILSAWELGEQVSRYGEVFKKLLDINQKSNEAFEIVCIVGKPLREWTTPTGRQQADEMLRIHSARVITYQGLIQTALSSYQSYIDAEKEGQRLGKLMRAIDAAYLHPESVTKPSPSA